MKSLDQFLHEAQGKCWHKFDITSPACDYRICIKCKSNSVNPSYSIDPRAYLELTEWAQKQAWWVRFVDKLELENTTKMMFSIMLTPTNGAQAIAEYFGWTEPTK